MDKLEKIFLEQQKLMGQFKEIYKENYDHGLLIPFPIKHPLAQKQLRQTAWYCLEELGEALREDFYSISVKMELVDAFHFLVELAIQSGLRSDRIIMAPPATDQLDYLFQVVSSQKPCVRTDSIIEFVLMLTWTIHELKSKPWKQNPKPTNESLYMMRLVQTFYAFVEMAIAHEMTSVTLYECYMNKNQENQNRIVKNL